MSKIYPIVSAVMNMALLKFDLSSLMVIRQGCFKVAILQGHEAEPVQRNEANLGVSFAGFAQLLRGGTYTGDWALDDALALALANRGEDTYGHRAEFTQLVRKAMAAEKMR